MKMEATRKALSLSSQLNPSLISTSHVIERILLNIPVPSQSICATLHFCEFVLLHAKCEILWSKLCDVLQYVHCLCRFDVQPEITRGEVRELWKTFITNTDKTLDFLQFTRHFGYSLRSAAFPNAKSNPPKRGDNDFRIRSRKLNCAADMLQDSLRAKVSYIFYDNLSTQNV